jgi:cytochrome c
MRRLSLIAVAAAVMLSAAPVRAADATHGKQLFQACAACHGSNGQGGQLGPKLTGVVGRKAGSLDDFRYSNAMKRSDIVWDESHLRDYVMNPQAVVKGNRMPFSGVRNRNDAADIAAYVKTLR